MLNENLKRLRLSRHLTQMQLAEKLNVSQSTITSWENGKRRPDLDFIPVIAEFYGVSINDIYGTDDQNPDSTDALDDKFIHLVHLLSPENRARAEAYIEGLLTAQPNQ
jgi:transcriptional regulator with XRE-family HTH domain